MSEHPSVSTVADRAGTSGQDSELLTQFLRGRSEPCPVCNYDLRDLLSARCPECGAELKLQVGSPKLRIGAFLTCLAPILMLIGFGAFIGIAWIPYVIRERRPGALPPGAWAMVVAGVIDVVLLFTLYKKRSSFLRQSIPAQRLWAGCSWLVQVAVFVTAIAIGV